MPAVLERSGETQKVRQRDVYPSLACAADGRAYLVFTSNRNGTQDVYLRIFDGQKWQPDRPLAASSADEFDASAIVDRSNRVWVSWTSNAAGPRYDVFVACLSGTSTGIQPMQITHSDDDAMHARMAADGKGRIWVTYYKWGKHSGRSRDKEVYARYLQADRWSQEIHVSPEDVPWYEDHTDPVLVAQGDLVVCAWSWDFHQPAGYSRVPQMPTIFLRKLAPTGAVGRPRAVSGPNADTRPTVAIGPDGRVWCVWESAGGHTREKMVSFSAEDLARPEQPGVGTNVSGKLKNLCTPCLAMNPQGAASLVWAQENLRGRWVLKQAAANAENHTWSSPRTLVAQGDPRFPSAAYSKDGVLWVAYSVDTENGREIKVLTSAVSAEQRAGD
jgi:hypothetical protein